MTPQDLAKLNLTRDEYTRLISPRSLSELKTMMFKLHPETFVARPNFMTGIKTEKQMLDHITRGELDGFVTITGGVERVLDAASKDFGFCMARCKPDPSSLGEGFDMLCRQNVADRWPDLGEKELLTKTDEYKKLKCKQDITMTRRNFERPVTISMAYLRWLIKERGLDFFSILHVYAYR